MRKALLIIGFLTLAIGLLNAVFITRSSVLSEQRELESALLSDRNCLPNGGRRQGHFSHPYSFRGEDLSIIGQLID